MNPISFAAGIVPGAGPVETIRAAAEGCFDMTGLWIEPELWSPMLLRESKAALAETGLPLLDVEVIWIKPGDALSAHKTCIDIGAELGASNVLCVSSDRADGACARDGRRCAAQSRVPVDVWLHVASFMTREWFSRQPSAEELLRAVDGISGGSFAGDFIEGIVAAMDALVRVNAGKAFNRILLLVTDAETAVEGVEDLEAILPQMQDLKNFALYIAVVGKVDAAASSAVKVENVKLLQSLAEQSGAGRCLEVASLGDAAQLLSAGLGLSTKPTLSKITLELSPEVRVPCAYYGPVSATPLPSLKKRSRLAAASAADDDIDDTAAALKRDIVYRDPDDAEREVDASLKVKGYRYGAQFVPVTTADEAALKAPFAGPPTVRVIGFVAAFISALIVVRSFLDFVSKRGFAPFAWWRIVVGLFGLAGLWIHG